MGEEKYDAENQPSPESSGLEAKTGANEQSLPKFKPQRPFLTRDEIFPMRDPDVDCAYHQFGEDFLPK